MNICIQTDAQIEKLETTEPKAPLFFKTVKQKSLPNIFREAIFSQGG
jgi:hypothetical protein